MERRIIGVELAYTPPRWQGDWQDPREIELQMFVPRDDVQGVYDFQETVTKGYPLKPGKIRVTVHMTDGDRTLVVDV